MVAIFRVPRGKLFHSSEPMYLTLRLKASQQGMAVVKRGASCALVLISLLFSKSGLLTFLTYIKFSTCDFLLSFKRVTLVSLWALSVL